MSTQILQMLSPPVFENEDKTRTAFLLNIILLSVFVLTSILTLTIFLIPGSKSTFLGRIVVGVVAATLTLVMWFIMRRGHLKLVGMLFLLILLVFVTIAVYFVGTIRAPIAASYMVCIVIAGLLIGSRAAGVFTLLSLLALLGSLQAEIRGLLPPAQTTIGINNLLLDIPDESPLRDPILTIRESGKKAATIVQDLLTLARRGVTTTDVLIFNDIVVDHMKSPENETLLNYHPDIKLETNLTAELPHIRGSGVHLKKTVMNLISNAAEAQPEGGNIIVSTKNQYIDKPLKGYDQVHEGEYLVLIVEDNGTGIAPDDLKRIFEPYTMEKIGIAIRKELNK